MKLVRLGVNIDHVATVRQARRARVPDPVQAAVLAEVAGAHGITVHLRADRRHIQDRDLTVLKEVVKTRLNVELSATAEMTAIALAIKPAQVTLVPERPEEVTTEGGLDVTAQSGSLRAPIRSLQDGEIEVSLFVDPVLDHVREARELRADAVELNTAAYSEAATPMARAAARVQLVEAARLGHELGLAVHAGHGLDYENVGAVAAIDGIGELNIGHSIVSRAVLVGMERAVREMLGAMAGLS
jgi:pyridoxine 5-phosphate synthase